MVELYGSRDSIKSGAHKNVMYTYTDGLLHPDSPGLLKVTVVELYGPGTRYNQFLAQIQLSNLTCFTLYKELPKLSLSAILCIISVWGICGRFFAKMVIQEKKGRQIHRLLKRLTKNCVLQKMGAHVRFKWKKDLDICYCTCNN